MKLRHLLCLKGSAKGQQRLIPGLAVACKRIDANTLYKKEREFKGAGT